MDDDIIGDVLRAEKACAAALDSAGRRCRERIDCRRQALERELEALEARLQQEHDRRLEAARDAEKQACGQRLDRIRADMESLAADGDLCAALQNRIIDIILEP